MVEKRKKSGLYKAVLKIYWQHTRKYPWAVALTITGVVLTQVCFLAAPLYMRKFFNLLASNTPTDAVAHQLYAMISIVAIIYLLEIAARRLEMFSNIYMQVRVMPALMETAFGYLINHSYNFFISSFAGSLTSKVSRFGRSFEGIFDNIVISFLPTALFVMGSVTVLFLHNKVLGAALGLWAIAFVAFQLWVSKLRQPIRSARAAAETRITAALADSISNQNTTALFSGAAHEKKLFHEVAQAWANITNRYWQVDSLIWAGIGLFITVIEIGLLAGAVYFWRLGQLTVGDFVLIQAYLITTFDRLVAINRELRAFFSNFADAAEMAEILETPHEVQDVAGAKNLDVQSGNIQFKNVTFFFKEDAPVLHDLNLDIHSHEKVALVGPSGAGKSTITKLLLRFFDIKSGEISIDGQNIAHVTQDSLRNAISFVPQEPILFHRTLMENIRYGRRDATDAEVIEAARQAHCHEFIAQLKDGYETYVGERGVKLSGGERQRVAIARAILKNSPILVLDEATSSLDSESEALIQDALKTLMEGKTVIVIAHRLSTIMNMDRIVVLENGTIAAQGTHQELVEHKGLYHKLWSIQAGGFITDDGTGKEEVAEEETEA